MNPNSGLHVSVEGILLTELFPQLVYLFLNDLSPTGL